MSSDVAAFCYLDFRRLFSETRFNPRVPALLLSRSAETVDAGDCSHSDGYVSFAVTDGASPGHNLS